MHRALLLGRALFSLRSRIGLRSFGSESEIEAFRQQLSIKVTGKDVPPPARTFQEAGFPSALDRAFAGFTTPSPIQSQGWPVALKGSDLIGLAETGSGKTLAYLAPALVHIGKQGRRAPGAGPSALVLAPTRELAVQISDEARKFSHFTQLRFTTLYGGASRGFQMRSLQQGVDLVIATPGRLIDLVQEGATNLRSVGYLVLDEADRMLDMGFEPQIREILTHLPDTRQTLLYSATWPKEVDRLARDYTKDATQIVVGNATGEVSANPRVKQVIEFVNNDHQSRLAKLKQAIEAHPTGKILVFVETKRTADQLSFELSREGTRVEALHGDRSQREREGILYDFKNGRSRLMIATSIAARGLDVKDISLVVNYEFPNNIEDYVHRIGRTARAGATGTAVSLFTPDDHHLAKQLARVMLDAKQEIPSQLQELLIQQRPQPTRAIYGRRFAPQQYGSQGGSRSGGFFQQNQRSQSRPYQSRDSGYQPRDSGYQPRDSGFQPRNSGFQPRNGGYQPRDSGYRTEGPERPSSPSAKTSFVPKPDFFQA